MFGHCSLITLTPPPLSPCDLEPTFLLFRGTCRIRHCGNSQHRPSQGCCLRVSLYVCVHVCASESALLSHTHSHTLSHTLSFCSSVHPLSCICFIYTRACVHRSPLFNNNRLPTATTTARTGRRRMSSTETAVPSNVAPTPTAEAELQQRRTHPQAHAQAHAHAVPAQAEVRVWLLASARA